MSNSDTMELRQGSCNIFQAIESPSVADACCHAKEGAHISVSQFEYEVINMRDWKLIVYINTVGFEHTYDSV